jgi:hypothetical protein
VIYVASTGSLMFVTVAIAIFYFKLPILWSAMKEILRGKNADEESMVGDS